MVVKLIPQHTTIQMIKVFKIEDPADLKAAYAIRGKVFVDEQKVPASAEYDEHEATAHHYLAFHAGVPCGAARWRNTLNGVKLERFAVLPEYRNKAVGSEILKRVLTDVKAEYPNQIVYLHAQVPAVAFYTRHGFESEGDMFSECDINHYKMVFRA